MTKIYRLTLTLIAVLTMPLAAAPLLARTQPIPLALLFTNPDGTPCQLPCLFGVRPGQTSFEDAQALLHAHPFTRHFQPSCQGDVLSDGQVSILLQYYTRRQPVTGISVLSSLDPLSIASWASLGEVVALLGSPEAVELTNSSVLSFYWAGRLEFVHRRLHSAALDVDDPFNFLAVHAQPPSHTTDVTAAAHKAPWAGFR